jgi:hypothetical protein
MKAPFLVELYRNFLINRDLEDTPVYQGDGKSCQKIKF